MTPPSHPGENPLLSRVSWRNMTTTFCPDLTLPSPSPRRFYAALTLSAGEHQVSEGESKGEFKVNRPGGACLTF
jgi:hypothetical protein